jgi:modulator of FtsH protease
MGLYNRDYGNNTTSRNEPQRGFFGSSQNTVDDSYESSYVIEDINEFVKTTYKYFAASLLAGAAGAYTGVNAIGVVSQFFWGLVILEFALIFGIQFARNKPGINMIALFAFTFITGLTLAPLLHKFLGMPGGAGIIGNAFIMTSVAFGALSYFAINTTKDFLSMGKILFIALIVMIVGGIINIFLHSPIFQLVLAGGGAILFSFFILFDTQNIIRGGYDSPVTAALSLYIDFLNLFTSLLQILGIFGSSDE